MSGQPFESSHRVHDSKHIRRRIVAVARRCGLNLRWFPLTDSPIPLAHLESRTTEGPKVFVSAGIHGDEPASTEALLGWLEKNPPELREFRFSLWPCINPWGIQNNTRTDSRGRDLNREFHRNAAPQPTVMRRELRGQRFDLAIMLHEDFDGQGFYLYEIRSAASWGERLVTAAAPAVGIDRRPKIDGGRARSGVLNRRLNPEMFRVIGLPEAVYLYWNHAKRVYTFESPSEFMIGQRVLAHQLALEEALQMLKTERLSPNAQTCKMPGMTRGGARATISKM